MPFQTVPEMLLHRIKTSATDTAFTYPVGNSWKPVSWQQFGEQARKVSMGLRSLGVTKEQRVAILCSTRYEWIVADTGIGAAAAATTTIYPSTLPDDCAYIINDSGSVVVIAETEEHVAKLASIREKIPHVLKIVTIEGKASADGWVISYEDLMKKGESATQSEWEAICATVKNTDLATLIYTSGTTGRPKGVELTQDHWVYEAEAMVEMKVFVKEDVQFLWLPLSHVFGKVLLAGQFYVGFQSAVDGRVDKIVDNISATNPTFVAAVPRIFEKAYNKIIDGAKKGGSTKFSLFKWALGVGREVSALQQKRQEPSGLLAMKHKVATKLVLSKVKNRFGPRLKFFVSGSAPLSSEMATFFHACGILILEGYGLTETSAGAFVNRPGSFKFGTVGSPLPGTQVKIAEDGEILIKGRCVMRGYKGLSEATQETIRDGWLHTGDIGEVDSDGLLRITDRKKDLIKTSGGKYVAPQALEGKFKASCPYVSVALVHGNNRNFCIMLVALDKDSILDWAKKAGVDGDYDAVVKDSRTAAMVKNYINDLNKTLASYESIKNFAILPKDLTEADGDLTPSMKLKRKAVETKYKKTIDAFYEGNVASV